VPAACGPLLAQTLRKALHHDVEIGWVRPLKAAVGPNQTEDN
jgi:hypothetical protein